MVEGQGVYYRSVDSQNVYFEKHGQLGVLPRTGPNVPAVPRVLKSAWEDGLV